MVTTQRHGPSPVRSGCLGQFWKAGRGKFSQAPKRHSHASQLLHEGMDPVTVSERLGHSSVRTTLDIYSHAMRGKDAAAARVWDAIQERESHGEV